MPDVIERAARAACAEGWGDPDDVEYSGSITDIARAALQAALDPADRKFVEHVARGICAAVEIGEFKNPDKQVKDGDHGSTYHPMWEEHIEEAVAAIEAIRSASGVLEASPNSKECAAPK